ncbi:MAG: sugar ABC transporter permease, partial [Ruminococcaceae bacterium]|nr:sugar ABC transporter permease [Oscillospiraceae bacterium]
MKTKNKSMIVIFLAPAIFLYTVVFLYPTIRTVIMSFFKVEGVTDAVSGWKFNGLGNFRTLFHTPLFMSAMQNISLIWLVGGVGVM